MGVTVAGRLRQRKRQHRKTASVSRPWPGFAAYLARSTEIGRGPTEADESRSIAAAVALGVRGLRSALFRSPFSSDIEGRDVGLVTGGGRGPLVAFAPGYEGSNRTTEIPRMQDSRVCSIQTDPLPVMPFA
jgi:hypothetical protein